MTLNIWVESMTTVTKSSWMYTNGSERKSPYRNYITDVSSSTILCQIKAKSFLPKIYLCASAWTIDPEQCCLICTTASFVCHKLDGRTLSDVHGELPCHRIYKKGIPSCSAHSGIRVIDTFNILSIHRYPTETFIGNLNLPNSLLSKIVNVNTH